MTFVQNLCWKPKPTCWKSTENRKKVRMSCFVCQRDTKYMCILCHKSICVVCAEPCGESDDGYDEDLHRVAKCSDCHGQSDSKQKSNELLRTSSAVSGKSKISDYFLGSLKNKPLFLSSTALNASKTAESSSKQTFSLQKRRPSAK